MSRSWSREVDYRQVGFHAMLETGSEERASKICGLQLQALQERHAPSIGRLKSEIEQNHDRQRAVWSSLYGPAAMTNDLRIMAKRALMITLVVLLLPTLLVSAVGHIVTLYFLWGNLALGLALGASITVLAATAGEQFFRKILIRHRPLLLLGIVAACALLFLGLYDMARARGLMAEAGSDTRVASETYVDEPSQRPAAAPDGVAQPNRRTVQEHVEALAASALIKLMIAADLILGIMLGLIIWIRTRPEQVGWRDLRRLKKEEIKLSEQLRKLVSWIEIAKAQMMEGMLRADTMRRGPPYFLPALLVTAVLTTPLSAQTQCSRLEANLFDVSGSVGQKVHGSPVFLEYLRSGKRHLQAEPPNSCVWVVLVSTNSFGAVPVLLRGWTPSARGIFTDDLDRARSQLVASFEEKSTGLSPVAAGTDIIGGLWKAKTLLESTGARGAAREVHMWSDMMNETPEFPMPALIPMGPEKMLQLAANKGLVVPMPGYRIHIYGATTFGFTPETWNIVRDFWSRYFERAGAELISYSSEVPVDGR